MDKVVIFRNSRGRTGLKPTTELIRQLGLSVKDPDLTDWYWMTDAQIREVLQYVGLPLLSNIQKGWRLLIRIPRTITVAVFNR